MASKHLSVNTNKNDISDITTQTATSKNENVCPYCEQPSGQSTNTFGQSRINENELFSLFTADVSRNKLLYFR